MFPLRPERAIIPYPVELWALGPIIRLSRARVKNSFGELWKIPLAGLGVLPTRVRVFDSVRVEDIAGQLSRTLSEILFERSCKNFIDMTTD